MEIERVGRTGGPGSRWRTVAVLASPLLAIAIVVSAALAGDGAVQPDEDVARPSVADITTPTTRPEAIRLAAGRPEPAYPDEVLGLRTRSVAVLRDERRRGEIGTGLVAVRGYLTIRPELEQCLEDVATPGQLGSTACVRHTLLVDDREPMLGWADDETVVRVGDRGRAHLHGWVFPGVSMAAAEAYVATAPPPMGGGSALGQGYFLVPNVPVVAIGRFDDPRLDDAPANQRHPDEAFTIERIAWVAGAVQRTPVVRLTDVDDAETLDSAVLATLRRAAADALPAQATILGLTVADVATLRSMDASVARVIGDAPVAGPVWHARAAVVASGPPGWLADEVPALGWAVVDPEGTLLGTSVLD